MSRARFARRDIPRRKGGPRGENSFAPANMNKRPTLNAEPRKITGRKVKRLRREGLVPANVFGKKIKSQAVAVTLADFQKIYQEVGETGLVDITVKGEKDSRPCLIVNVHAHPVTDLPLHADFHQVDLTQKVTANVPVELTGESPAVKEKGALLITLLDEIEVEALPTDLPEKFTVDVTSLKEFDDAILVKDLQADSKVTIKTSPEEAIVKAQEPKEEEVPVDLPAEALAEEGAPTAEGEAKPGDETKPEGKAESDSGKPKPAEAESKPEKAQGEK